MSTRKLKFIFLLFILNSFLGFNQVQFEYTIPWLSPLSFLKNGQEIILPQIKDQGYLINKPHFFEQKETNLSISSNVSISSFTTSKLLPEEKLYIENNFLIDTLDHLIYEAKVASAQNQNYLTIDLFPFIIEGNQLKKIVSFNVLVSPNSNGTQKSIEKAFAVNSVLKEGSGEWYKISVLNDGVHKIDKNFLISCGINVSNLDPNSIHVFGNGEGKLPELNSVYRSDDLVQNSVEVVGGGDGQFNDNDYVLFNGWGPNRWYFNSTNFIQDKNIYSDVSYYFINIDNSKTPLIIQNTVSFENSNPNYSTSSYSYFQNYEQDLYSLVGGGQRWYGELFDVELSKNISFNIPNIESNSNITFTSAIASNSSVSSGTNISYSINGTSLYSTTLPTGEYGRKSFSFNYASPASTFNMSLSVTRATPSTLTYLDFILLNCRRKLVYESSQFNFRDINSLGNNQISSFQINTSSNNLTVWRITDRHNPKLMATSFLNSILSFKDASDSLNEYTVFSKSSVFTPTFVTKVKTQNLHSLSQVDYLMVTHKDFLSQAERLAELHRSSGLEVHVVTTEQVFNEFSSGMLDPTAIKDLARMFYERGSQNQLPQLKYLLLFGYGTYDPKNRVPNNNNFVPTYQVVSSEYDLSAMVTDDYFGMMDANESISSTDMLDIGVGRLLISDLTTAKQQVDKIEHYLKNGSSLFNSAILNCNASEVSNEVMGDWRNKYVLITDDEEGGYFINQDAEPNAEYVDANFSSMNCEKIYIDAYKQTSNAGGQRYQDVEKAISNRIESGVLVMNYIGHGGEKGAASERIITIPQIQNLKNINNLNLFVSATCEFTKYDDPSRVSAGEWMSLNTEGGAIALMTTTRAVFFGVNTVTGRKFYENVFKRDVLGSPQRFGDIIRLTKNASGSSDNKRSFTLIGDPALKIALPTYGVVTDSINGVSPSIQIDTLKALTKVSIKGHVIDFNGAIISDFNGVLSPTIFDKKKLQYTLGQDPSSPIIPFNVQKNVLYRGKVSVVNGFFDFSFIVPKDIDYSFGNGKLSFYASNNTIDAQGNEQRVIIGGVNPNGLADDNGPEMKLFLNDDRFVDGGLTNETPNLLVELFDENGINTVGNGIGHDITLELNGNTADPIILNNYYTSDLDSYQSGKINYTFEKLEPGEHSLKFKVWDVNNNSSEYRLNFIVQESQEMVLKHVLNYPNPFTTSTDFYFEHNQVCSSIEVQIQIFTVSGKLVKTINKMVNTSGFRSEGINWDGLDDYGDQIGKGVYIYKLSTKLGEGMQAEKIEKLVILR